VIGKQIFLVACTMNHLLSNHAVFLDTEEHSPIFYKSFFEKLSELNIDINYKSLSSLVKPKDQQLTPPIIFVNLSEEFLKQLASKKQNIITKTALNNILIYLDEVADVKKKIFFLVPAFCKISDDLSELKPLLKYFRPNNKKDCLILKLFLLLRPEAEYNFLTSLRPGTIYQDKQKLENHLFFLAKDSALESVFLVKNQAVYFGSIVENFNITPFFSHDQNLLHSLIKQKLKDVLQVDSPKTTPKKIDHPKKNTKKKLFAWIELPLIDKNNPQASIEIDEIINNILAGKIEILWITPAINDVFSKIAIRGENKESLLKSLKYFLSQIKQKLNFKPMVYFSCEITNNLVSSNLPKNCNVDVFGNKYFDQPNPLDNHFWYSEVCKPFRTICQHLKEELDGVNYGILLDLEMYLRKTGSTFGSTSGLGNFSNNQPAQIDQLFKKMERNAFALGKAICKKITSINRHSKVAVYMPTIIPNWFYFGFLRAISSFYQFDFFSFASNFEEHQSWLEQQKIIVNHYEFFMLSKLNLSCWKNIIKTLQNKNSSGFGFNRFSRINKYTKNSWFEWEQTHNQEEVNSFFEIIRKAT